MDCLSEDECHVPTDGRIYSFLSSGTHRVTTIFGSCNKNTTLVVEKTSGICNSLLILRFNKRRLLGRDEHCGNERGKLKQKIPNDDTLI